MAGQGGDQVAIRAVPYTGGAVRANRGDLSPMPSGLENAAGVLATKRCRNGIRR